MLLFYFFTNHSYFMSQETLKSKVQAHLNGLSGNEDVDQDDLKNALEAVNSAGDDLTDLSDTQKEELLMVIDENAEVFPFVDALVPVDANDGGEEDDDDIL